MKFVGLIDSAPLVSGSDRGSLVFTDATADLRPSNAAAHAFMFSISPDYFQAAGTALLSGRTLTWHDDKNAPLVAVINQELARKTFGSVTSAMGHYFKQKDGTRIQVVGIVEDGKYKQPHRRSAARYVSSLSCNRPRVRPFWRCARTAI